MSPDKWLALELGEEYFSGNLEHLKIAISKYDLYPKNCKIITIGGTNGKGQTSRLLGAMLHNTQRSYALWTSPHLETVAERLVINGQKVDAKILVDTFNELKQILASDFRSFSYFEFIFLSMLVLHKKIQVEFLILEVGLGGRLDATNSLSADIACVVSISREHQRLLGDTYRKILFEKLGITRTGKVLVSALELKYLRQMTENHCKKQGVHLEDLFNEGVLNKQADFSLRNFELARRIFSKLTGESKIVGLTEKDFSFRSKVELGSMTMTLFPTHNLDGFRKLFQFLNQQQYNNYDYLLISFSEREWKDLLGICEVICAEVNPDKVKLVSFDHIKAIKENRLIKLASEFGFDIVELEKFYEKNTKQSNRVLVTGSNYFLGHVLKSLPSSK